MSTVEDVESHHFEVKITGKDGQSHLNSPSTPPEKRTRKKQGERARGKEEKH